jgi:Domain of unknown function (DUF5122) beta-propeller
MNKKTTSLKGLLLIFAITLGINLSAQISQTVQPAYLTNFPTTNGIVYSIVWDSTNNAVYIGGTFTQVGGQTRLRFAAIDANSGSLLAWNPSFNNDISSLSLYKGMLYVGGSFTSAAGQSRKGLAKFNASTKTITSWSPPIGKVIQT